MNTSIRQLALLFIAIPVCLHAADTEWSGAADDNFFNDANWSAGAPSSTNDHAFIDGGQNLPAVIAANTGTIELGAVSLGALETGGHVVQNGGTLIIFGDDLGVESQIGDLGEENSSWIMNGNATILYDDPLSGGGLDSDGTGKDFDVGKSVPEGAVGRLEMHDSSIFRISDDLKLSDGDVGHSELLMDGNSQLTVGSGISASGTTSIVLAGNSLLVTGNSAGPGMTETGSTDEGYLTLSTGGGEFATVEIRDSAKLYARTLQQRGGESIVTVRNNGQFHIFDVFENAEPALGTATVSGSVEGPQRTSHVSASDGAETTISLLDNAVMTVDSDLEDSAWSGLVLSGGTNTGGNTAGGLSVLEIADNASFSIQQDLHMTLGNGETAESTLRVKGPDASVNIVGDLRMAIDDFGDENFGVATLHAELTGNSHSEITVGGSALIGNGSLLVTFSDYTPIGGETYNLISAGAVEGTFLDAALPMLADGLTWDLAVDANSVVLSILGGGLLGDFNNNGVLDIGDIDMLTVESASGANNGTFDLNSDGNVDAVDVSIWAKDLANTWIGDSNLDGEFNSGDFVQVFSRAKFEQDTSAVWSDGDWNGDGRFNSSDFVNAFSDAGYEKGPRPAQAVPESMPVGSIVFMTLLVALRVRREII